MRDFTQIRLTPDGKGGLNVFANLPGRSEVLPIRSLALFSEWMEAEDHWIPASRRCPEG